MTADPIAYTYEADTHCPPCAVARFGAEPGRSWPRDDARDSEGNPVGAVFPWDEWHEPSDPSAQTLACGTCGTVIDTRAAEPVTAADVRSAILEYRPTLAIAVEQTGGGTATLYVGEYGADGRAWLAFGPGTYDCTDPWQSRFLLADDATIGPDDDGQSEPYFPTSADDVARYVSTHCECRGCASVNTYTHGLCAWCIEHPAGAHVEPAPECPWNASTADVCVRSRGYTDGPAPDATVCPLHGAYVADGAY